MADKDLEQFMQMTKNKQADLDKELDEMMEDDPELKDLMNEDESKPEKKKLEDLDDSII